MSRMKPSSPRIVAVAFLGLSLALGAVLAVSTPAGAESAATVHAFGGAPSLGAPNLALNAPIVGIAATHSHKGYWLLASDGGIFSYGDAHFYGSTGAMHLNQPVVGISPTPSGRGIWLVASDGAIFTTGTARYAGGANGPNSSVEQAVGIARAPKGHGYWVAMSPSGPPLPANSGFGLGRRIVYSNTQQRVW